MRNSLQNLRSWDFFYNHESYSKTVVLDRSAVVPVTFANEIKVCDSKYIVIRSLLAPRFYTSQVKKACNFFDIKVEKVKCCLDLFL